MTPEHACRTNDARRPPRVFITGIGAITPIGSGAAGLWAGVRRGETAVRRITRFDPSPFPSQIAAEVDGFDGRDFIEGKALRRLDRFSQFAVAAARLALEDAGLSLVGQQNDTGVYLGSALGGIAFAEEQHHRYVTGGPRAVSPALALSVFGGAGATNIAIALGITGPTIANANSCASGAVAIGEALLAIRSGRASVALAGGAEAPLAPLTFGSFALIKAMSTANHDPAHASRPFDLRRDGFVMAEGAAVLVLESQEHAEQRDAPVYAELLGYGASVDAYHMTAPLPGGEQAARAVTMALATAGVPPGAVGYVNAHGSSTPLNDRTESLVLHRALGRRARTVPVSGTKGLHGHALGATGAIEAAICALTFRHDWLPPTANLEQADPACDLALITGAGRPARPRYVLSTSFGFGGINAALVLGRA